MYMYVLVRLTMCRHYSYIRLLMFSIFVPVVLWLFCTGPFSIDLGVALSCLWEAYEYACKMSPDELLVLLVAVYLVGLALAGGFVWALSGAFNFGQYHCNVRGVAIAVLWPVAVPLGLCFLAITIIHDRVHGRCTCGCGDRHCCMRDGDEMNTNDSTKV